MDEGVRPDILQALRKISREYCQHAGGAHGPDHCERVLQTALALGTVLEARRDILTASALSMT